MGNRIKMNYNLITSGDSVCNKFAFTIQGDSKLDYLTEAGLKDPTIFDGYKVHYDYTLEEALTPADNQLTCFGFNQDPNGYFCVGVFGDPEEQDMYASHGA